MAKQGRLYQPTDADREFVERCICSGDMSINDIAECLNITDDTLRKHYRYEIVTSRARLKGKAVGVIANALDDGSVDAAKFVLARQAGWSEKTQHDLTSSDGSMTPKPTTIDASKMSTDALRELMEALNEASPVHKG